MTGHVPLDYDAVAFRADIESMRDTAAQIFAHPNIVAISILPMLSDMGEEIEEELWFETGICPSPALWPDDIAGQAVAAWKAQH